MARTDRPGSEDPAAPDFSGPRQSELPQHQPAVATVRHTAASYMRLQGGSPAGDVDNLLAGNTGRPQDGAPQFEAEPDNRFRLFTQQ